MGKLWKNNLFKLPIFLLAVSGICGASLAAINYFTSSKIAQNEKDALYRTYTSTFEDLYTSENKPSFEIKEYEVPSTLLALGITSKVEVTTTEDESVGFVYSGTVDGFVDEVKFTVSFANGCYHHFSVLSQKESKGNILSTLDGMITNYSAGNETSFFSTPTYTSAVAGASRTDDHLVPALEGCANDYYSIYQERSAA